MQIGLKLIPTTPPRLFILLNLLPELQTNRTVARLKSIQICNTQSVVLYWQNFSPSFGATCSCLFMSKRHVITFFTRTCYLLLCSECCSYVMQPQNFPFWNYLVDLNSALYFWRSDQTSFGISHSVHFIGSQSNRKGFDVIKHVSHKNFPLTAVRCGYYLEKVSCSNNKLYNGSKGFVRCCMSACTAEAEWFHPIKPTSAVRRKTQCCACNPIGANRFKNNYQLHYLSTARTTVTLPSDMITVVVRKTQHHTFIVSTRRNNLLPPTFPPFCLVPLPAGRFSIPLYSKAKTKTMSATAYVLNNRTVV